MPSKENLQELNYLIETLKNVSYLISELDKIKDIDINDGDDLGGYIWDKRDLIDFRKALYEKSLKIIKSLGKLKSKN